jgi:tryptophan-rich sensory protein
VTSSDSTEEIGHDPPGEILVPDRLGPRRRRTRFGLFRFVAATAAVALMGARVSKRGGGAWYRLLRKPRFNPPARAFGPVWTTLYGLMSWSAYRIWKLPDSPERTRALRIWGTQLALNGLWTPLFFGKHAPRAALLDLATMTTAIVAYIKTAAKLDRVAGLLMAPYLGWVGFAGILNGAIIRRNRAWI